MKLKQKPPPKRGRIRVVHVPTDAPRRGFNYRVKVDAREWREALEGVGLPVTREGRKRT